LGLEQRIVRTASEGRHLWHVINLGIDMVW
jgi:hypothetical protein